MARSVSAIRTSVPTISAFLSAEDEWSPKPLRANGNKSFQGSIVLGMGFTMSEAAAQALIARDAKNGAALFPYLNGEELNSASRAQALALGDQLLGLAARAQCG